MSDENSNDQRDNIAPGTPVADIDINQTGQDEISTGADEDQDALETEAEVGGDADIPAEDEDDDTQPE